MPKYNTERLNIILSKKEKWANFAQERGMTITDLIHTALESYENKTSINPQIVKAMEALIDIEEFIENQRDSGKNVSIPERELYVTVGFCVSMLANLDIVSSIKVVLPPQMLDDGDSELQSKYIPTADDLINKILPQVKDRHKLWGWKSTM